MVGEVSLRNSTKDQFSPATDWFELQYLQQESQLKWTGDIEGEEFSFEIIPGMSFNKKVYQQII